MLRELLDKILCGSVLGGKGDQERQLTASLELELFSPTSKHGRKPALINTEFLIDLKLKIKVHGRWKQGQATWWQYKDIAQIHSSGVRKAKD